MRNKINTLVMAAVLGCAGMASAIPVTDTLADLVANHGSIGIGDKVFSNFYYQNDGLTTFDATHIQVTASIVDGVYYLTWGGNISLANFTGLSTADLLLNYRVTANGGLITSIDQQYTGGVGSGVGSIGIAETVSANGTQIGSTYLSLTDTTDPAFELGSDQPDIVPPQSVLDVTKDISLGIDHGLVSVSQIQQSFHQTPDGGLTVALLGFALVGVEGLRRRLAK
jgi:hypothetical protein